MMWRHGDMATWRPRSGRVSVMSVAEQGNVAMSPCRRDSVLLRCSFGPASVTAPLLPILGSSISVPALEHSVRPPGVYCVNDYVLDFGFGL